MKKFSQPESVSEGFCEQRLIPRLRVGLGFSRKAHPERLSQRWPKRLTWNLSSVGLLALIMMSWGLAEDSVPFVSAVDRFGRHGQIDVVESGRLLISELGCVKCHASDAAMLQPKGGPSLIAAGNRLDESWVRDFIADPSGVHPGTTMPQVLDSLPVTERRKTATDIAAFLATQRQPFTEIKGSGTVAVPLKYWARGKVEAGRNLYQRIGCVACHAVDERVLTNASQRSTLDAMLDDLDEDEIEELGLAGVARPVSSVPHPNLAAKYTRQGLTHFLLDPDRVRPGGRMPNFKLTPVEAADLAGYLIDLDATDASVGRDDREQGDALAGKRAFQSLRCDACHDVGGRREGFIRGDLPRLVELRGQVLAGCLQQEHSRGPAYGLDDFQRNAIVAAIRSLDSTGVATVEQRLQHRMMQLNCYACHQRDDLGGVGRDRQAHFHTVGNIDLGDEGRLPPPLSGVGRKIRTAWMTRVLAGNKADIRPHMTIRMPKFHRVQVDELPKWFASVDSAVVLPSDPKQTNQKLVQAGRELMDVGCVQCHRFDGFALPGVVGVDLAGITGRLNREWFQAFLRDPGLLKPRTRMPNFFADGSSQDRDLLSGDPDRQIDAMWAYLSDVPEHSLPQKIQDSRRQDYELKPIDRPLLLRTFMPVAGTHAIAVGFPEGVHFAFDAERVRLATAWRGEFLDAQGTWFVRFAPPADPLGTSVIPFPTGSVFATASGQGPGSDQAEYHFDGYRLDKSGVPTFLYRHGDIKIEDRITANADGKLRRTWRLIPLAGKSRRIAFAPLSEQTCESMGDGKYVSDSGITALVKDLPPRPRGRGALVFELELNQSLTLQTVYTW